MSRRHPSLCRSFGWEYRNRCSVDLTDLLMELDPLTPDLIFYDVFLQVTFPALPRAWGVGGNDPGLTVLLDSSGVMVFIACGHMS